MWLFLVKFFCNDSMRGFLGDHRHFRIFNLLPICMKCCFFFLHDYLFQRWENLPTLLSHVIGLDEMVDKVLRNLQNNG